MTNEELDRLVAEKVVSGYKQENPVSYSTDAREALELLNLMIVDRGFTVIIMSLRGNGGWRVGFHRNESSHGGNYWANGATIPLAVCRAALATTGDLYAIE